MIVNKEVLLLNKWISMIVHDMRVKTFHLSLIKPNAKSFELPSSILESDHIRKLTILGEPGSMFKSSSRVDLKHLQTLSLCTVHIPKLILDSSILSSCLLLERVSLERCQGFTRIKLQQPTKNLTAFYFRGNNDDVTIEIVVNHIPTLETIQLLDCSLSVRSDMSFEYASLTHLSLTRVQRHVIGKLKHQNIVMSRAICYAKEEKLLVCDYIPNGSLHVLLHGNRGPGRIPLDLTTCLGHILGAARGLEKQANA